MFRNLRAKSESIFSGFISDFDNKQKNCFKHNIIQVALNAEL